MYSTPLVSQLKTHVNIICDVFRRKISWVSVWNRIKTIKCVSKMQDVAMMYYNIAHLHFYCVKGLSWWMFISMVIRVSITSFNCCCRSAFRRESWVFLFLSSRIDACNSSLFLEVLCGETMRKYLILFLEGFVYTHEHYSKQLW